jgi:hypothetical protein
MASHVLDPDATAANPLELMEQIVASHDWPFDRSADGELSVAVAGTWCEYHLCASWRDREQALQLTCTFDARVPPSRRADVAQLLVLINEQLWLGHFDLWSEEGVLMFRYGMLMAAGATASLCEDLIEIAIGECERFYPAFQLVLWGGKAPAEALAACLFETVGEA